MKLIALLTLALASTASGIILHGKKIDEPLPEVYSNDEFM